MMRHPTTEELDALYPRSAFIDDESYEIARASLSDDVTCDGCEDFIDIKFDVDGCLSMDGVCRKHHVAIPSKIHSAWCK